MKKQTKILTIVSILIVVTAGVWYFLIRKKAIGINGAKGATSTGAMATVSTVPLTGQQLIDEQNALKMA